MSVITIKVTKELPLGEDERYPRTVTVYEQTVDENDFDLKDIVAAVNKLPQ